MTFGAHSTIRQLLANEAAKAIIEKHLPGATNHPQLDMALDMTLREVATYPEANISAEKLKAIVADLEQLG